MVERGVALAACLMLASCASEMKKGEADLATLESWLPGRYDNLDQTQEEARKGVAAHATQKLGIAAVHMPTFGDHVFYLQESAADDPRRITTQRLLAFEVAKGGHIIQRVYTLAQPGRWRDGHLNPDVFKGMMYQDATALAGCELEWKREGERFVAANQVSTCRVTSSALGGTANLQMRVELTNGDLSIAELAFGAGGQLLQGNAEEPFYRYRKRSGA